MRSRRWAEVRGSSVVEVIVAIVVLAVGLLALASSVHATATHMSSAYVRTRLHALGQSHMERLLADGGLGPGEARVADGDFFVSWRVSDSEPSEVSVVVGYASSSRAFQDTLLTLRSSR